MKGKTFEGYLSDAEWWTGRILKHIQVVKEAYANKDLSLIQIDIDVIRYASDEVRKVAKKLQSMFKEEVNKCPLKR